MIKKTATGSKLGHIPSTLLLYVNSAQCHLNAEVDFFLLPLSAEY